MKISNALFLLIGILMLVCSWYFYLDQKKFISNAEEGVGEVVDIGRTERIGKANSGTPNGSKEYRYLPVVQFSDNNGTVHEFVSNSSVGSNRSHYQKGEQVNVLYTASDPTDAIIDSFWDRWMWIYIFGGLGAVFSLVGVGSHWSKRD